MARWQRVSTRFGGWRLVTRTGSSYVVRRSKSGPWVALTHGRESEHRTLYGARMAAEAATRGTCDCRVCWYLRTLAPYPCA